MTENCAMLLQRVKEISTVDWTVNSGHGPMCKLAEFLFSTCMCANASNKSDFVKN